MSTSLPPTSPYGSPDPWQQRDPAADGQGGAGGLAVAALALGVAAFLLGLVPLLGLLLGAAAVVLGLVTVRRSTRGVGRGWTFGLVGVVGGGLAVLASLVTSVLLVLYLVGASVDDAGTAAAPAPSPTQSRPSTPSPSPTPSRSPSPPATPSEPAAAEPVTGRPGEVVTAANGLSYTVTNLTCGLPSITRSTLTATARGQYCVVDVTVANGSSAPAKFYPTFTRAYAGDVEFAPDIDASVYADTGDGLGLDPINPGQSQPGKIAFDVPTDVTPDRVLLTVGFDATGLEEDPGVSIDLS